VSQSLLLMGIIIRAMVAFAPDPLWYDEAFSVLVARLPLRQLLAATAADVHPPLYYMLLRAWLHVVDGLPLAMRARSLSFVLSLVVLALWALVLRHERLDGVTREVAWWIALIVPSQVWFAAEARMYMLLTALVLALWRVLHWRRSVARAIATAALVLGVLLTHNAGLVYVAVLVLFVQPSVASVLPWSVGVVSWALLWGLPSMAGQVAATSSGYWVWLPNLGTVVYMLYRSVFYAGETTPEMLTNLSGLVFGACTFWAVLHAIRQRVRTIWVPVLVVVVLVALSYILGHGVLLHRVLLPASLFLSISWASVLMEVDEYPFSAAFAVTFAVLWLTSISFVGGRFDSGIPWAVEYLQAAPADVVYVNLSASPIELLLYDLPAPVRVSPDRYGGGMQSGLTTDALAQFGVYTVDLDALAWQDAWVLLFESPFTPAGEIAYMRAAIAAHDGVLVQRHDDEFTWGELWRLTR